MLVSNPERFVIIPNIDEGAKFVIAHEAKENISPKETSAITSNGTHIITPSSGFNAMKEVEVDVFVPVPTTEEKSVDITRNGEVEILPTSADAMTKVIANVQVPPPPLEEKQVTITSNGTTIVTPDNADGLSKVEVVTDVPEGFDLVKHGETQEFQDKFNGSIEEDILYTINFFKSNEDKTSFNKIAKNNQQVVFLPNDFNYDNVGNWVSTFESSGIRFIDNIEKLKGWGEYTFRYCTFNEIPSHITFNFIAYLAFANINVKKNVHKKITINWAYKYDSAYCKQVFANAKIPNVEEIEIIGVPTSLAAWFTGANFPKKITCIDSGLIESTHQIIWGNPNVVEFVFGSMEKCTLFGELHPNFSSNNITTFMLKKWKQADINLQYSPKLSIESIHHDIQNAMSVADGAVARTLTLHATAKTNWEASEYYQEDLAVLEEKGITIA